MEPRGTGMIGPLLRDLDAAVLPDSMGNPLHQEHWDDIIDKFAPRLCELGKRVFNGARDVVGDSFYRHSTAECLVRPKSHIVLAQYRHRPPTQYYTDLHKPLPAPDDPSGYDATGIQVSLDLRIPFIARNKTFPAQLGLKFDVWGSEERLVFLALLRDYRRPVERLLQGHPYAFFSSVPFDNVDKYRGSDPMKKLELYAENEIDDENQFSLSIEYRATDATEDLEISIIPLLVLYDCTIGYAKRRRDRDRMLR
jgi:hypothetical protein